MDNIGWVTNHNINDISWAQRAHVLKDEASKSYHKTMHGLLFITTHLELLFFRQALSLSRQRQPFKSLSEKEVVALHHCIYLHAENVSKLMKCMEIQMDVQHKSHLCLDWSMFDA